MIVISLLFFLIINLLLLHQI